MRTCFISIVCVCIIISCNKKKDTLIDIQGFLITDNFGNVITNVGAVDDDWKINSFSSLSVKEQELVNFADNVTLENTSITIIDTISCYPNPANQQSRIQFRSNDSVKLKLVLVDESATIYHQFSQKIKGTFTLAIDVSDRSKFASGKSMRYIYSFSAINHMNFKAGHGDIKICDNTNYTECF